MDKIKRFKEFNGESLNENWKNWAVALGIASASLFSGSTIGQTKLKDKIESIKDVLYEDPVLKKLIKDGYEPLPGSLPISWYAEKGNLVDSDISILSNTLTAAKLRLSSILMDKNIKPEEDGFFVYRDEGSNVRIKWITSEVNLQKIKLRKDK